MAINKVVNKAAKSHGAMRNMIEYVLKEGKNKDGYIEITGPYEAPTINYDDVYKTWLTEKILWDKDSGRMCAHNIISFHKDERTTPEEVLDIGRLFADKFFSGHQCLLGVHQDKDHLHCHIVTNSVSYIDGSKLHQTKKDLERQKKFTNELCHDRGLSIAEKGHHFDGTLIAPSEIIAWDKDKYNLLINDSKKSYVSDCAKAIIDVRSIAKDKEDFITLMNKAGWSVQWEDSRKHIVFQNESGQKVRDSNIEKTFPGLKVSKDALSEEFAMHRVSDHEQPIINHAPDSRSIATDNKPETPSKPDRERISFKEKLAQKKKEADLFNREHTTRVQKNREHISR